jgi:hypothetical protein
MYACAQERIHTASSQLKLGAILDIILLEWLIV